MKHIDYLKSLKACEEAIMNRAHAGFVQTKLWEETQPKPRSATGEDDLLPQAIEIIKQNNKASVSLLQRKLRIGYSRAARLIELLEDKGMVAPTRDRIRSDDAEHRPTHQ